MQIQLGSPALIFLYTLALLLLGCSIGIHWSKNPGTAVCVSLCAALLMVIHDLLEGFAWIGIIAAWTRMLQTDKRK
jgi:hypothetical protein